jgi:NAD(P)H-hydrate epimerase
LVAGKYGTMGAAVLAARAAHRTGIGLLTAHLPEKCVNVMQTASPETIVQIDELNDTVSAYIGDLSKFNAIGIGPGIGLQQEPALLLRELLQKGKDKRFVIDADAITILGQHKDWLELLPENAILTPHPKEFERIAGKTPNHYQRNLRQIELSKKYKIIIVLKGAYTAITLPDGRCFFNTTGNPSMATGGSGDVLTGMILSLLAQGYEPADAAMLGVYLHGLAGDLAAEDLGEYSLLPSDIIEYIPEAYFELQYSNLD